MNKSDIPQHVNSRQLAKDTGYGFFHGSECRKGHNGLRYVSGHCVQCQIDRIKTDEAKKKKAEYRASEAGKSVTKKYNIKHYYDNYEYNLNRVKNWQENNSDKVNALRKNNQWRKNISTSNYRAKKNSSAKGHTCEEIIELLDKQKHKCINCNIQLTKQNRHLDHIMPISKGGSNDIKNLQWLCRSCNLSKHAKEPIAWAQSQGRLL